MEQVHTLIIGAGAVGLAIARELSVRDNDLVVVDKEMSFGQHTSSRNSEVIHAGHYYKAGSLKAGFCVQGNQLLYGYLRDNSLPYKQTGKIIVATEENERSTLQNYLETGKQNGCLGMKILTRDEVIELEPRIKCIEGLFVPSTGIFDTHKYMQCLATEVEERGAFLVYGMEVTSIKREAGKYIVEFSNGEVFQCTRLVNSAGLWADQIASLAGLDTGPLGIDQHWCKGEYYKTTKISDVEHLVYPVADPTGIFLGIHLTLNLNGEVRFGPNAYYVDEVDYHFEDKYLEEFHKSVNRYLDIAIDDLMPDDSGIRAKLQGPDDSFRDFYIKEETASGMQGFVNLIGIESPGLTASLAIGRYVATMLNC